MSNISSVLGTAGGANGTGWNSPEQATLQSPTTTAQAQQSYDEAQNSLAQQRGFVNATQPGGTAALQSQQNLLSQLQGVANGTGPNPAMAQLAQTTGQNIAQQGALQAGQRGSSANTGLAARNIAQQGGQLQQQAVGQGATMAAQQQLAGIQQLGAQQQAMIGQQAGAVQNYGQAAQNEQSNILNAVNAQNQAQVGSQNSMNAADTNLIGQTAGQQESFRLGSSSGAGSAMSAGAEGGKVSQMPKMATGGYTPVVQPQVSSGPMSSMGQWLKGSKGGSGGGSSGGAMGLIAQGAKAAYNYLSSPSAENSATDRTNDQTQQDYASADASLQSPTQAGPQTAEGVYPGTAGGNPGTQLEQSASNDDSFSQNAQPDTSDQSGGMSEEDESDSSDSSDPTGGLLGFKNGGKVPAMVSPGEQYLPPKDVKKVLKGANPYRVGEKIPGKPVVGGAKNSYANDIIPKTLDAGGIVLPRSVTQAKHPEWAAHKFIAATIAKNKGKLR